MPIYDRHSSSSSSRFLFIALTLLSLSLALSSISILWLLGVDDDVLSYRSELPIDVAFLKVCRSLQFAEKKKSNSTRHKYCSCLLLFRRVFLLLLLLLFNAKKTIFIQFLTPILFHFPVFLSGVVHCCSCYSVCMLECVMFHSFRVPLCVGLHSFCYAFALSSICRCKVYKLANFEELHKRHVA